MNGVETGLGGVSQAGFASVFDPPMASVEMGFCPLAAPMDALAARLFMIDRAQVRVDVQTYLFHDDVTGALVTKHLMEAADRGVKVRILLDDYDAAPKDRYLIQVAQHPNIDVRLFNPNVFRNTLRTLALLLRLNRLGRRMHNKAMLADGQVALFGGRNIGDVYFALDDERLFLDYDLLGVGHIAAEVQAQFDEYWNSPYAKPIQQLVSYWFRQTSHRKVYRRYVDKLVHFAQSEAASRLRECDFSRWVAANCIPLHSGQAALFYDSPQKVDLNQQTSPSVGERLQQYLQVERELVLVSPYLIPTQKGLAFFRQLRERGVSITLVTNSLASTDVLVAYSGYLPYYRPLLDMGIRLYEVQAQSPRGWRLHKRRWRQNQISLHTKLALVDDRVLLTGSANFDPRSNQLNTELLVALQQPQMVAEENAQLKQVLNGDHVYQLGYATENGQPRLIWQAKDGQVFRSPPQAGGLRRGLAWLISRLPIEGYL